MLREEAGDKFLEDTDRIGRIRWRWSLHKVCWEVSIVSDRVLLSSLPQSTWLLYTDCTVMLKDPFYSICHKHLIPSVIIEMYTHKPMSVGDAWIFVRSITSVVSSAMIWVNLSENVILSLGQCHWSFLFFFSLWCHSFEQLSIQRRKGKHTKGSKRQRVRDMRH